MTEELNALTDYEMIAACNAYVECALWSGIDYNGDPLDNEYGTDDIDSDTLTEMHSDVINFIDANLADLQDMDPGQIGHDFWLTRNGHGAGFWDRGLGEIGERLSRAAKVYGDVDLYVTADGRIYS